MRLVVGIDFGTQSARCVLADAMTGEILHKASRSYPHGILPGDLASAADYDAVLMELLQEAAQEEYRDSIRGICVDATSYTLVPLDRTGEPLSYREGWEEKSYAQIRLWKCHSAQKQADEALALAQKMNQPFLGRCGGSISCEWALPKLLEIRDEAPEIYAQMDLAMDLCEFLSYRLTGLVKRSAGAMGFKCLWARDLGFPEAEYLNALRPGFAREYRELLRGEVYRPGEALGCIRKELAQKLGLREDTVIACGVLDGHTALAASGALQAGDAVLVVGTSSVVSVHTDSLKEIPGICGIARDGLIAGLYGIDAGQCGSGDMLDWFIHHALPEEVERQALCEGISVHDLLARRVKEPWKGTVHVTDWWNGSRNVPCDLSLKGAMVGVTLDTRPEDIYLAMLKAIVCGTREIVERCEEWGIPIRHVRAMGGIAVKNPLLMQEYANILNRSIEVGDFMEGPALGSALFASVACGIHANLREAYEAMGVKRFTSYEPDQEHRYEYESYYRRNHALRDMMIQWQKT